MWQHTGHAEGWWLQAWTGSMGEHCTACVHTMTEGAYVYVCVRVRVRVCVVELR